MKHLSAWGAYTGSISEWLEGLLDAGKINPNDIVWGGPDGSYGAGEPSLEEEGDPAIMEMVDCGSVAEWLDD